MAKWGQNEGLNSDFRPQAGDSLYCDVVFLYYLRAKDRINASGKRSGL